MNRYIVMFPDGTSLKVRGESMEYSKEDAAGLILIYGDDTKLAAALPSSAVWGVYREDMEEE